MRLINPIYFPIQSVTNVLMNINGCCWLSGELCFVIFFIKGTIHLLNSSYLLIQWIGVEQSNCVLINVLIYVEKSIPLNMCVYYLIHYIINFKVQLQYMIKLSFIKIYRCVNSGLCTHKLKINAKHFFVKFVSAKAWVFLYQPKWPSVSLLFCKMKLDISGGNFYTESKHPSIPYKSFIINQYIIKTNVLKKICFMYCAKSITYHIQILKQLL